MRCDRTWKISKGPVILGANFQEGYLRQRFVASNQTLSPTFQGSSSGCFIPS